MPSWVAQIWRSRPPLGRRAAILTAPCFVAGAAVYMSLSIEPDRWATLAGVLAAALLAVLTWRFIPARWPAIWLLALALGFGWALASTHMFAAPRLDREGAGELSGRAVWIEAGQSRPRLELADVIFERYGRKTRLARARVRLGGGQRLQIGDRVKLRAVMRPPPDAVAPGGFDFRRDAFFKRIGAVGFAIGPAEVLSRSEGGVTDWLARLRSALRDSVYEGLDARPATAGVIAALVVGDRSGVTDDDAEALRASGLAHLLAISGLHLGLAASVVYLALRLALALPHGLALRLPAHKLAAVGAILAAAFYLGLSGGAPPAQRAFVMVVAGMIAILTDRLRSGLWFVAWAAVVVAVAAPHVVVGPSFQLSFAAATAIVAVYEAVSARRREEEAAPFAGAGLLRPVVAYAAGVAGASLVATAATAPLALAHFQQAPAFGVLANLAAMPVMAFWVMPLGVVACLLAPLGLAAPALWLMAHGVEAVLAVAHAVAGWEGGVIRTPATGDWPVAAFFAGGVLICALRGWPRIVGVLGPVAAVVGLASATPPDLLAARDGRLAGVVKDGALYVTSLRSGRFERDVWRRQAGVAEALALDGAGDWARCDDRGCAVRLKGALIALSLAPDGLPADCRRADVLVALHGQPATPEMGCAADAMTIDGRNLAFEGAHAVWIDGDSPAVVSVRQVAGERPWTAPSSDRRRTSSDGSDRPDAPGRSRRLADAPAADSQGWRRAE